MGGAGSGRQRGCVPPRSGLATQAARAYLQHIHAACVYAACVYAACTSARHKSHLQATHPDGQSNRATQTDSRWQKHVPIGQAVGDGDDGKEAVGARGQGVAALECELDLQDGRREGGGRTGDGREESFSAAFISPMSSRHFLQHSLPLSLSWTALWAKHLSLAEVNDGGPVLCREVAAQLDPTAALLLPPPRAPDVRCSSCPPFHSREMQLANAAGRGAGAVGESVVIRCSGKL